MKFHVMIAAVLTTALLTCGQTDTARAQTPPLFGIGQITGDADGRFAAALTAALDAAVAAGRVPAPCAMNRQDGDAAPLLVGQITDIDGAVSANIAAQGATADPATMTSYGPSASIDNLAATIAADLLRRLCDGGADIAPAVVYEASGGGAQITISGRVAALDREFTLEGAFPGGTAVFTYVPVSAGGGAVSYEIAGSGVTGAGDGVYTTAPQADGTIVIDQTTDGCIDGIPNSCRTNTDRIVLTPVAP